MKRYKPLFKQKENILENIIDTDEKVFKELHKEVTKEEFDEWVKGIDDLAEVSGQIEKLMKDWWRNSSATSRDKAIKILKKYPEVREDSIQQLENKIGQSQSPT